MYEKEFSEIQLRSTKSQILIQNEEPPDLPDLDDDDLVLDFCFTDLKVGCNIQWECKD